MSRFRIIDPPGTVPVDYTLAARGDGEVVVPDAHLLFSGTFKRAGPDLWIEGDGVRALLPDYFAHETGATLLSLDGARLGPDTVRALSGMDSPWQVAQAGGAAGPIEIGTVKALSGTATVQRGGALQPLGSGEPVYRGDVVETGAGSSLGIILRDNTVFSLSAGARMVMNELVYDPARTDNSMAVSLVQGTFVFITGQVATSGTVAITTPVATMGIRGTTPIVKLSTIDGSGEFSIAADPGGPVGAYILTLPTGLQTTVASTDIVVRVSSASSFNVVTKSALDVQTDQQIVAPAYQVFSLIGQRGDLPSQTQQANVTGKGQAAGGFQYAFAVFIQNELVASQLLDNTVLGSNDPFGGGIQSFEDGLRKVTIGAAVGIDLDTTQPGINRSALFPENAASLPVTSATQIILPPNVTQLSSATVVLQNQFAGDNLLVGALPPGITVTITFGSIHVNLSGVASAADYIAAIQAIRFINTSDNPSTAVRIIDVTVTTINGATATATTFVTIEAINDAPVNHLPGAQLASEDAVHVFSSANGNAITISDPDAGTSPITTALSVQHGTLTIAATVIAATGVVVSGNGTQTLIVTGPQSAINAALDGLAYLANVDFHGADSLLVSTNDNGASGGGGALITISLGSAISVAEVNDAPQGHDNTIAVFEDKSVTLRATDFGFTDLRDNPADLLLAVKIATVPGNGHLTLAGADVMAGQVISVADIDAGRLVWTPGHDEHSDDLASLTFQVQDNGGTANGGIDLDPTPNTLTFNVAEVNDAPQGHDNTIAVFEDKSVTLRATDFGFTDLRDNPADLLLAVKIATVPGNGHLTLAGADVMAGQVISVADIDAGRLVWTPGHDEHSDDLASLTFQVQDNGGTANGGIDLDPTPNTLTFNVAEVNDAPVARNDQYATREDYPLYVTAAAGVIGNDSDIDGNALLAVLVTGPAYGSLTLRADGSFTYTPTADYNGTDSFTYVANDGTANSNITTVSLTIDGINDAPINTVPTDRQQVGDDHSSLIFSTSNGNPISIFDIDAGEADMQVVLAVKDGVLMIAPGTDGVDVNGDGTSTVTLIGSQSNINSALEGLSYTSNSHRHHERHDNGDQEDEDEGHGEVYNDQLIITSTDLGHSGAAGPLSDTDVIILEIGDGHDSSNARSAASFPSIDGGGAFTGVGAAVDLIDFSTATFVNATTIAFGVDAPIDATYAADLLSHFDSATRQIDLAGIIETATGAGAANSTNVADCVHAVGAGSGQIDVMVESDGKNDSNAPVKIDAVSGTAGTDQDLLGTGAGDIISVVFDQMQPAAHIGIGPAG